VRVRDQLSRRVELKKEKRKRKRTHVITSLEVRPKKVRRSNDHQQPPLILQNHHLRMSAPARFRVGSVPIRTVDLLMEGVELKSEEGTVGLVGLVLGGKADAGERGGGGEERVVVDVAGNVELGRAETSHVGFASGKRKGESHDEPVLPCYCADHTPAPSAHSPYTHHPRTSPT
jgi:hypothetical protein